MGERVAHARRLFSRNSAENGKDSYGMGGRKEFLRNAGLGELGGLARDTSLDFLFSQGVEDGKDFYGMSNLVAWRLS